ncbi:MAG: YceI family protein [Alphaproteobacteria bacterium]|nr:YceI family protein [Alphaproteobacteria bacterium]
MIRLRSFLSLAALGVLVLSAPAHAADAAPAASGAYQLDNSHASITFKINHLGFSRYTGRFDKMEGTLNFNSEAPEKSAVDVTIYPNSVDTNNVKLEEELRSSDKGFDVIKHPRATFRSTKVERTSPTTGKVTGDFTFMGVTHPVTLDVTLIGSGAHPMNKKPVIGFSASGSFKRSDYGYTAFLPMVGDEVSLQIEAEFNKAE